MSGMERLVGINGSNAFKSSFYDQEMALQELYSYESLSSDDWDGYGAAAINERTLDNAVLSLKAMLEGAPAPEICPNPHGTISFEWSSPRGLAYYEIGETKFSFFLKLAEGQSIRFEGEVGQIDHLLPMLIANSLHPKTLVAPSITGFHGWVSQEFAVA
jgi:hypothetical protein